MLSTIPFGAAHTFMAKIRSTAGGFLLFCSKVFTRIIFSIRHLHISPKMPLVCTPKFCLSSAIIFSWTSLDGWNENKGYIQLGANKVYYGRRAKWRILYTEFTDRQIITLHTRRIKLKLLFKRSYLNFNFALTPGGGGSALPYKPYVPPRGRRV